MPWRKIKSRKGWGITILKRVVKEGVIKKKVRQTYENISGKVPGMGNVTQKYLRWGCIWYFWETVFSVTMWTKRYEGRGRVPKGLVAYWEEFAFDPKWDEMRPHGNSVNIYLIKIKPWIFYIQLYISIRVYNIKVWAFVCFLMWTIFKIFIEFVTILLLFLCSVF